MIIHKYNLEFQKEEKVEVEDDPEMARYLNRSYWESRTESVMKRDGLTFTLHPENVCICHLLIIFYC